MLFALFLALFLPSLVLPPASAAPPATSGIDFATLDAVIASQMSKHGLPGVALAVVEGDQVTYLQGYGAASRRRPMTYQTQMFIGSQSKSFTALAIAQLAEQGKLDLEAPVQTYIPWFRVADETASRQITIDHLLHHTSGLSESGYEVVLSPAATVEEAVRSLSRAQLTAPVGSKHQYFNLGYSVLAYLVEVISGESYADYLQEHIFVPLGMKATTADPSAAINLAQGYSRLFGVAIPMEQSVPLSAVGEGYIISTAEDMARYAIAMQNGGAGLVSPEMIERIFTPGDGSYGMGWIIVDGGAKIYHGGANETFRTEVNLYPERERAFVLLTNQGHLIDHFVSAAQLTSSVEAVVLGQDPPPVLQGWSMRWFGWGMGIACLALLALHTRNFLALQNWREHASKMPTAKRVMNVAVSFLIPTVILIVVKW